MTSKALLIGINYFGTSSKLNGCINDVKNVRAYLGERFEVVHDVKLDNAATSKRAPKILGLVQTLRKKFEQKKADAAPKPKRKEIAVLILTDDLQGAHKPTKANILAAIEWLVKDTQPGDSRFLHYSGHGSQVRDANGDEPDGLDECICPCDYSQAGMIIDEELRARLIDPLPAGAQLSVIVDACRSGSALDLAYCYTGNRSIESKTLEYVEEQAVLSKSLTPSQNKYKETRANVVCWSGCMDSQTSADAYMNGAYAGALTKAFLEILRDPKQDMTYQVVMTRLTDLLAQRKFEQKPQLTSGKLIKIGDRFDVF